MDQFLQLVREILDDELRNIETDMATGVAKDYGDYKFHCGRHRGLLTAKSHIIDTYTRLLRDEED